MVAAGRSVALGVIGGSGLYAIEGLAGAERVAVETPFGAPSDEFLVGSVGGTTVAFLARHGRGHRLLPTEINYRANVWALKRLGARAVLSASAVGSLEEGVAPLDVVVPDQFLDRTRHRVDTFFGDGIVAHVSLADPVCPALAGAAAAAARAAGARVHEGGTYVCIEGPQFSTRAESHAYRGLGARVIGMTNMQEARLCREAELCYATLALVTDYDCWKTDEEPVTVDAVVARLRTNAARAAAAILRLAAQLPDPSACRCGFALDGALITPREALPEETARRLGPVLARVLAAP